MPLSAAFALACALACLLAKANGLLHPPAAVVLPGRAPPRASPVDMRIGMHLVGMRINGRQEDERVRRALTALTKGKSLSLSLSPTRPLPERHSLALTADWRSIYNRLRQQNPNGATTGLSFDALRKGLNEAVEATGGDRPSRSEFFRVMRR